MVAPNGARRGKADHPALPVTDDEIVQTAIACYQAGADGIHAHLRDAEGAHVIDAGRYRTLLDMLHQAVPDMYLQVTTESAGRYEAPEQIAMVRALQPRHISVALRETVRSPSDWPDAADFYHWAADQGIAVQHILYSPSEVEAFCAALKAGKIPGQRHLLLFVRGSYAAGSDGAIALQDYLAQLQTAGDHEFDWMLCAFGQGETDSLVEAALHGGKARVGFENSLHMSDGSVAPDNAARVRQVDTALRLNGL
jgi:uncharacterized protein (DUF849 family)